MICRFIAFEWINEMCSPLTGNEHKYAEWSNYRLTLKKKKSVNCCDWWQIFLLGLHNDSHFPSGTLGFSFHDATNTLKLSTSSTTDLLRRTQTGKQTGNQPNGAALVWRLLAGLRRSDVSDGPSLPSAWRCTETLPSPLWPSSWRWGRRDCSEAACGPHLRPASAHRTDGQMQSDNSLMRGTLKTQCVRSFMWIWELSKESEGIFCLLNVTTLVKEGGGSLGCMYGMWSLMSWSCECVGLVLFFITFTKEVSVSAV